MFDRMRCIIVIAILWAGVTYAGVAQEKKFGDISKKELNLSVYEQDSSASALTLFDYGEVYYDNSLDYELRRHVRIKIFNEAGYGWATIQIPYNEEYDQKVFKIKAATYQRTEKGDIQKFELDDHNIFEEKVNEDWKRIKFTLPKLSPGAVIEYSYRKKIGTPDLLPDWEFQKGIPVLWSEYRASIPEWFDYNKLFFGRHPIFIEEKKPFSDKINLQLKSRSGRWTVQTSYHNYSIEILGNNYRWVMKDLPAVKELPYMTSVNDYRSKLWLQLVRIKIPGQLYKDFLNTWENVTDELLKSDHFGKQLSSRSEFQQKVTEITSGEQDSRKKASLIYQYVRSSFTWDQSYGFLAYHDLSDVFDSKKGSGTEINLLLIQLLRDAGFESFPLMISTRKHGTLKAKYPVLDQFNHTVCLVAIEGNYYLADATAEDLPLGLLPENDLNGEGLVIDKKKFGWVTLKPTTNTRQTLLFKGRIEENGSISGNLNNKKTGLFIEGEKQIEDQKEKYFREHIFQKTREVKLDSLTLKKYDPEHAESEYSMAFSSLMEDNIQVTDEFIYFNPMIFNLVKANPFKQPKRKIPVDYPYTFSKIFTGKYSIPDGYEVDKLPKPMIVRTPDNSISFKCIFQNNQGVISLLYMLQINKTHFSTKEYPSLRKIYSLIAHSNDQRIVLKKSI